MNQPKKISVRIGRNKISVITIRKITIMKKRKKRKTKTMIVIMTMIIMKIINQLIKQIILNENQVYLFIFFMDESTPEQKTRFDIKRKKIKIYQCIICFKRINFKYFNINFKYENQVSHLGLGDNIFSFKFLFSF